MTVPTAPAESVITPTEVSGTVVNPRQGLGPTAPSTRGADEDQVNLGFDTANQR